MLGRNQKVAVASRSFSTTPALRNGLLEVCPNSYFNETGATLEGQSLIDFLGNSEVAVVGLEAVSRQILIALPGLRVIAKYGVGLDNIDVEACRVRGVDLLHSPGTNSHAVAELALSSAIQLLRRVPDSQQAFRDERWQQHRGRDLEGCTFGVVGCGNVGKKVAQLARSFGCTVLSYDIERFSSFYEAFSVEPVSLPYLLAHSDVISIHLPFDDSTRGILGAEEVALMKPEAVLLNYARGGLVDEEAVAKRLQEGSLWGAAFDVFEDEPYVSTALKSCPRTILTCHIGGSSEQAVLAMGNAVISNLHEMFG